MAYTDELAPLLTLEQDLRRAIALRIAEEAGEPRDDAPSRSDLDAADTAIAAWQAEGEEAADSRAFRPIGPLQALLADHREICVRIDDMLDRRLS